MDCIGGIGNPVLFIANLYTYCALIFRNDGLHFRNSHATIAI